MSIPVERLRAAIRVLYPDDMTPDAKRVLDVICDEHDPTLYPEWVDRLHHSAEGQP